MKSGSHQTMAHGFPALPLVDHLAAALGCTYVSDLHYLTPAQKSMLVRELKSLPAQDEMLWDWNDALAYLTNAPHEQTAQAAKEKLLSQLAQDA